MNYGEVFDDFEHKYSIAKNVLVLPIYGFTQLDETRDSRQSNISKSTKQTSQPSRLAYEACKSYQKVSGVGGERKVREHEINVEEETLFLLNIAFHRNSFSFNYHLLI